MKTRAPRNRTLQCNPEEIKELCRKLLTLSSDIPISDIANRIICQDMFEAIRYFPRTEVDLLILDPPYNLSKNYNGHLFREKEGPEYIKWFDNMISHLVLLLKPHATVYICSDWRTSVLIAPVIEKYFFIQNRITWERDKGRGANKNWKNNTEDIWFCTISNSYVFNINAVKIKRKVIAPYRKSDGTPKDWEESNHGNFRITHPSNIWTDITIPFWSMPENTDHPTQKPEKLIAKLILASSNPGDIVLDPFLGSGTSAVVAKKLNRRYIGIEQNKEYCCNCLKRLNLAEIDKSIQGYSDGIFWERNSISDQPQLKKKGLIHQRKLF